MFCLYGDRSRNLAIERLETESPRLVRVRTVSRGNDDARVSLPQTVHTQLDTGESLTRKESHTRYSGIDAIRSREGAASYKSRLSPKKLFSPRRGILRSPKSKFPYEKLPPHELWSVDHADDTHRVEVGRLPGSKSPPASDVVRVHAYRRKGYTDLDIGPEIIVEEVSIRKGDIVVLQKSDEQPSETDSD